MHDPMIVITDIKICNWHVATLWHVDPETDGTDDSCGWGFPRLTQKERDLTHDLIFNDVDNVRYFFHPENNKHDMKWYVNVLFRNFKRINRPWWKHPRWHIHHWSLQLIPVQNFKRWAFSRCAHCGKRFDWGRAPLSTGQGNGATWFKGEAGVYHHQCYRDRKSNHASTPTETADA